MMNTESLVDGRIMKFYVPNVKRETLETWTETVIAYANTLPIDQPLCVIHDFSSAMILTPALRDSASQILSRATALGFPKVYVAVIIQLELAIARLVGKPYLERRLSRGNAVVKACGTGDEALEWMMEQLAAWEQSPKSSD